MDVALLVAYIGGIWVATFYALATLTGWQSLARRFPASPPDADADRGFGSVSIGGWGNYNNCIRWAADERCLHLRLLRGFNLFHAPMSIPWGEVQNMAPIERGLRRGWVTLHIGPTTLTIPGRAAQRELALRAAIAEREGAGEVL
jgi:hypothetical protein